ncbi:MAG: radical SAM protein [Oscillospiraceae bacterium]|nr:radical SAM protein [Oscillospiraceae bacterium]
MKTITRLSSGGIIANYRCPAACGHCLYGCSPGAEPGYIDKKTAAGVCENLRRLGCKGVHIGGGEPFLNVGGLVDLIKIIDESGLRLEYIETNAAWITGDGKRDRRILSDVADVGNTYGKNCIMVSADPFHVEFIPFWKPERLIRLFEETGTPHFIWQERFLPLLRKLDPMKTYDGKELENIFGYDVTGKAARDYGLGFKGRALNLLRKYGTKKPVEPLLGPCPELYNTNHFHADFMGRYIPPGCAGMGILLEDLGKKPDPAKYPVISRLFEGGVGALFEYALEAGYKPNADGYFSKCELCFDIRKYLIAFDRRRHPDLMPESFYRQDF